MVMESSRDERLVEVVAWVSGTVCSHCGRVPKGHKWILDDTDEIIAMLCPDGTRTKQDDASTIDVRKLVEAVAASGGCSKEEDG